MHWANRLRSQPAVTGHQDARRSTHTIIAGLLLAAVLLPGLAWATVSYELAERIYPSHGVVAGVAWLDSEHYLTLSLTPDGTEVSRHTYPTASLPEPFISANFMRQYVCGPELAGRLSWTISPRKNYLFFNWFTDSGNREWVLIDISGRPDFRIKRFEPPAGMQIRHALFSPDDRFVVFVHDAVNGGSDVSLLMIDLAAGVEHWRLTTEDINFVDELWWGGAMLDAPRFWGAAKLYDGQFQTRHGLASFDLQARECSFALGPDDILCGAEAIWGRAGCLASTGGGLPYYLEAEIPGQSGPRQIPLSAHPVAVQALSSPGLVLLSNTTDWITNQLWLIDVLSGDKHAIDADCAQFSLAPDGKLLVQARTSIELRVYVPVTVEDAAIDGGEEFDYEN